MSQHALGARTAAAQSLAGDASASG